MARAPAPRRPRTAGRARRAPGLRAGQRRPDVLRDRADPDRGAGGRAGWPPRGSLGSASSPTPPPSPTPAPASAGRWRTPRSSRSSDGPPRTWPVRCTTATACWCCPPGPAPPPRSPPCCAPTASARPVCAYWSSSAATVNGRPRAPPTAGTPRPPTPSTSSPSTAAARPAPRPCPPSRASPTPPTHTTASSPSAMSAPPPSPRWRPPPVNSCGTSAAAPAPLPSSGCARTAAAAPSASSGTPYGPSGSAVTRPRSVYRRCASCTVPRPPRWRVCRRRTRCSSAAG